MEDTGKRTTKYRFGSNEDGGPKEAFDRAVDRREFLKWTATGALLGLLGSLFGESVGLSREIKSVLGEYWRDSAASVGGKVVKGEPDHLDIALVLKLSEKDTETVVGGKSDRRPYMFLVWRDKHEGGNAIIFLSADRIYQTPEGRKRGTQIIKDFSGIDVDNTASSKAEYRRFNYIEALCSGPFDVIPYDADFTEDLRGKGYGLERVLVQYMK